jgi:hypothetical protein
MLAHPIVFGYRTSRACTMQDAAPTPTSARGEADRATSGRAIRDSTSTPVHQHGHEPPRAYTSSFLAK